MPVIAGLVLLGLLGWAHYAALLLLSRAISFEGGSSRLTVLATFLGLATIHVVEIAGIAVYLLITEHLFWPGGFAPVVDGWWDYHYLAFSMFTSLGYGDVDAEGPVRILLAHVALGGFMVITWSATFLYDVSRKTTDFGLSGGEKGEGAADEDEEAARA